MPLAFIKNREDTDKTVAALHQRLSRISKFPGDEENPMTTKKSLNRIVAVMFAVTLLIGSGAQAGSLFSPDGARAMERTSLLDQAATWIAGTWTGFTSVFSFDSVTPNPPSTQSCITSPAGCGTDEDAGPGIDPEG
jgi:hypothetical protein